MIKFKADVPIYAILNNKKILLFFQIYNSHDVTIDEPEVYNLYLSVLQRSTQETYF